MSSASSVTVAASSSSLWNPKPSLSKFPKFHSCPSLPPSSPPCFRVVCRSGCPQHASSTDLSFALHDALKSPGVGTSHTRSRRPGRLSFRKFKDSLILREKNKYQQKQMC